MSDRVLQLKRQLKRLERRSRARTSYERYRADPAGYARDVLGVTWWPRQIEIAESLLKPPYRTLVPSGHDIGKTHTGAGIVNWWYDVFDPSVVLTTAPKLEQVKDLLWKEIRNQRKGRPGFTGPRSMRLQSSPKHFAKGITANQSAGFHGQHEEHVLVVIDEAEGVEGEYWDASKSMATGQGHAIVAFYNPTTTTSQAALEERAVDKDGRPSWNIISMSALDHPNIERELRGEKPLIPAAIRLAKVDTWVQDWCTPIDAGEEKLSDIQWRPKSGQWWRPGPIFEARALGRRPSTAVNSVWSDYLVARALTADLPMRGPLQIGCDVARFGDDFTAIHVRIGGTSVHHESYNGYSLVQTAARLQEVAHLWGMKYGLEPRRIPIAVDDCGVGGGVVDILAAGRWRVIGVNAGGESPDPDEYPNLRSALWFDMAAEAAKGNVSFAKLPRRVQDDLRLELTAPLYKLDLRGRRVVEPKSETKERLRRSPDNADAVLLAFSNVSSVEQLAGKIEVPK